MDSRKLKASPAAATPADDHHPAGARCCGRGSPRPFVASYGLRALMVKMIVRAPAGIALVKVLPRPEPGQPGHLHSEEGMPTARPAAKVDRGVLSEGTDITI